ncbi:MAG: serine hydroxymethyltransferase [Phycisphaerae bacterium]|nr:serine hydroxymethyltransferase [Phycisphaerae bacterium]NIV10562.1 serine hydroxymethyltransferase [Fodinibius sp.]NIP53178.1 serine hydroxymethyltransferase [Phycisphaerae bacterium]NIS52212.1 serine hydroxymethyltransferase [Phycisphaerae bacterium]NIU09736.1 serine hydroxymethyltransferase [Phycisphaerae bacterium]
MTEGRIRELLEGLSSQQYHQAILDALKESDGQVYELLTREYERRQNTLQLGAAENQCSAAVLAALGSVLQNKTAEGFAGARLHGGCEVVDDVEGLAADRAKEAFGAQYANVQPHSGTQANQIVLTAVLESGDKILSMALEQGGHYSHGSKVSFTGRFFEVENYYVDKESFVLDYDAIRGQALKFKPKLIICGASAYTRTIDFKRFREIADEVEAYLLADVSHISGLIIAGAHPSPVDYAHFTTTSTYKPGGPRGGLILMGRDFDRKIKVGAKDVPIWEHIDEVTFPGVQGTPYFNNMAAKAVFFKETLSDEYRERQFKIVSNAQRIAKNLVESGHDVVTGGTDNHMVLVNVVNLREGLTGVTAQKCLEECGIVVDMIHLPYEKVASAADGIRLGTPIVTKNGMGADEMDGISALIDSVLRNVEVVSDSEYKIDGALKEQIITKVKDLCSRFPMR